MDLVDCIAGAAPGLEFFHCGLAIVARRKGLRLDLQAQPRGWRVPIGGANRPSIESGYGRRALAPGPVGRE